MQKNSSVLPGLALQKSTQTKHYVGALFLVAIPGSIEVSKYCTGVLFWLTFCVASVFLCLFVRYVLQTLQAKSLARWSNISLLLLSTVFALAAIEGLFLANDWLNSRPNEQANSHNEPFEDPLLIPGSLTSEARMFMQDRIGALTLPEEWQLQFVPGTARDYIWHKALHQEDRNRFRRSSPFPPKNQEAQRIIVVGDSLTYGVGVAKQHTYSAVLQRILEQQFNVEILNLGVSGYQTTDILEVLKENLPLLQPDLVIYGVCLNDFLPSQTAEYRVNDYAFPLPTAVKTHFVERSKLARFVSDSYDRLLLLLGFSLDFIDDILKDFDGYQTRFAADVAGMSNYVISERQTPFVAMVLQQYPRLDDRGHKVVMAAETYLTASGVELVDSFTYIEAYEGRKLNVSPWEGHPNELAHALFASMLYPTVERHLRQLSLEPPG